MRRIRLAREGLPFLIPWLIGAGAIAWKHPAWALPFLAGAAGMLFFFRDPERVPPAAERAAVSPADGRIRQIDPARHGGATHCISIYLSLLDVHVNRVPVSGRVKEVRYSPGRFLPAFLTRAEGQNENNLVVVQSGNLEVGIRQIAGWLARRIVCYCRPGQPVQRGQRLGLIRFGSCVQLTLPAGAQVVARPGQRVRAGETVLALLPQPGGGEG